MPPVETATESRPGHDGVLHLDHPARRIGLVAVLVLVFLTFGLPRFLTGDSGLAERTVSDFERLCRAHNGTPGSQPGTTLNPEPQPICNVRYGKTTYLMDAITAEGFDADTAKYQQLGCEDADRQAKAATRPGHKPDQRFVYHADTGVCEHRP